MRVENVPDKKMRVVLLDEIRGAAIICMVFYHAAYLMVNYFGVSIPFFNSIWLGVIRDVFAGLFVFISGVMCRYSHSNLKRGAVCFFCGMIITFMTALFTQYPIVFGVLHCLGISMLIYGVCGEIFERLPAWLGLVLSSLAAALTWNIFKGYIGMGAVNFFIPKRAYEVGLLFPLGMYNKNFVSADYFPLFPWFFIFIGGSYFGYWAKNGSLSEFFYRSHIKALSFVGKYTLWIYLLHIPAVYIILTLVFRFLN